LLPCSSVTIAICNSGQVSEISNGMLARLPQGRQELLQDKPAEQSTITSFDHCHVDAIAICNSAQTPEMAEQSGLQGSEGWSFASVNGRFKTGQRWAPQIRPGGSCFCKSPSFWIVSRVPTGRPRAGLQPRTRWAPLAGFQAATRWAPLAGFQLALVSTSSGFSATVCFDESAVFPCLVRLAGLASPRLRKR